MPAQLALGFNGVEEEDPAYLSEQLLTYIGNKRALLKLITLGLERAQALLGQEKFSFLDLFAGSGIISRYARRFATRVIANDFEDYSVVVNRCYLTNKSQIDWPKLEASLRFIRERTATDLRPGFITQLYAPRDEQRICAGERVFYTRENAIFLDTARRVLDEVDPELRLYLLAPLLSAASVHANTSGVFKGFYKGGDGVGKYGGGAGDALKRIRQPISWRLPILSNINCPSEVHGKDANVLVREVDPVDVAYFDPPYNQHPYGSNYFMLNILTNYRRPLEVSAVSGIPVDWKRSIYNKRRGSCEALFDAIENCPAKIVLISYSSEGFIPFDTFIQNLLRLGGLDVLDIRYNTFRGCRNLHNRDPRLTEFLFVLDKR